MMRQLAALILLSVPVLAPSARGQATADSTLRLLLRLDGGSMNPDDPLTVSLAYGGQIGWQVSDRNALFFRVTHQELSQDVAGFPRDDLRSYLSAGYERYIGAENPYRQQFALRFGAGAVFRHDLGTAPFVSGGVAIRYPLSRRFAFLGTFEDALVMLPTDTLRGVRRQGKTQHNFGMFISLELRQ